MDFIEDYIKYGVDINNVIDVNGFIVFYVVVNYGWLEMVKFLIIWGVNFYLKSIDGYIFFVCELVECFELYLEIVFYLKV